MRYGKRWDELDKRFKERMMEMLISQFLSRKVYLKQKKNAGSGFAKECAVVITHRLKTDPENPSKLIVDPEAKLEEELIVRPTSEAIIWKHIQELIQSYEIYQLKLTNGRMLFVGK